jgi:hypothetical protein
MDERELERLAPELGARAAAGVDPVATGRRVEHRLRAEPVRVEWWRRPGLLAAAAVLLVLAGGLLAGRGFLGQAGGSDVELPTPIELVELGTSELAEVLDSLTYEAPVSDLLPPTLANLDEPQLEQLLRSLEG